MKRRTVKVFFIVITIALAGWAALFVMAHYPQWKAERNIRKTAEGLKRLEEEDYQRAMADTYGGKTPQETLTMFIEAVEAGDYELASKYFIGERQGEWRENLRGIINSRMEREFLNPLILSLDSRGEYSLDEDKYFIEDPVAVDFRLYPNGIWKIIEI